MLIVNKGCARVRDLDASCIRIPQETDGGFPAGAGMHSDLRKLSGDSGRAFSLDDMGGVASPARMLVLLCLDRFFQGQSYTLRRPPCKKTSRFRMVQSLDACSGYTRPSVSTCPPLHRPGKQERRLIGGGCNSRLPDRDAICQSPDRQPGRPPCNQPCSWSFARLR